MGRVIGIDLGTSNSAAAVMEGGRPVIIPSAEGAGVSSGKAFPSFVAFTKEGDRLVGEPARRQAAINPDGTIYAAKRKMGTDHKFKLFGKEYSPQQVSAFILQKIKQDAEAYLGDTVEEVVITCPAYFDDNQRTATKDAGEIAGLKVLRIINEPTAACLAYGLEKAGKELKILVFDFGGGTLDVTIMEMWKEGGFKVVATSGDTQLGGTDMDNAFVDYVEKEFQRQTGIDLKKDTMATQRVREAAEKAKVELSSTMSTDINLPFITADATGPKHLTMTVNRAKLEELIGPIVPALPRPAGDRPARRPGGVRQGRGAVQRERRGHRQDHHGRRTHAHAHRPEVRRGLLRKEDRARRGPHGVRGHGRGHPGGHHQGRGQGRASAGRHPAFPRHRDPRGGEHEAHRAQHHHPHAQERDLLHGGGQPDRGDHPRPAGRAAHGQRQRGAGQVQPGRHPAGARAAFPRWRSPSTSTPTAS